MHILTTVQIVGIAVAAAIVVGLIVALIITRDRGKAAPEELQASPGEQSFLDAAPRDEFHRMGRAEPDTETHRRGPYTNPRRRRMTRCRDAALVEPDEEQPTDAAGPPPASNLIPLSDIIVTTSDKLVDLADAEVRRMLKELVGYEIDQAAQFKAMGQNVDAVLQLTEAEKICLALDMHEQARQIRTMMRDLGDESAPDAPGTPAEPERRTPPPLRLSSSGSE